MAGAHSPGQARSQTGDVSGNFPGTAKQLSLSLENLEKQHRRTRRTVWPPPPKYREPRPDELEALKLFSKRAGPTISELRGFTMPPTSSDVTMEDVRSESPGEPPKKKKPITLDDPRFLQHCMDWNIWFDQPSKMPVNYQQIKLQISNMATAYGTPANLEDEFKEFIEACGWAQTKANVVSDVFPFFTMGSGLKPLRNVPFDNLQPLTDGNVRASAPEMFDCLSMEDLHFKVRQAIGKLLTPMQNVALCSTPNLLIDVIAQESSLETGARRLIWHGAMCSRGMVSILHWAADDTVPDAAAFVFSVLFSLSGILSKNVDMAIYMHHSIKPDDNDFCPWYIMTPLAKFSVTQSANDYLAAKHTFKAVVEIAQQLRRKAIDAANLKVRSGHPSVR